MSDTILWYATRGAGVVTLILVSAVAVLIGSIVFISKIVALFTHQALG